MDADQVRKDFPIYEHHAALGKPFVYLDSAASSQKPRAVLDAMDDYYETTHANVHRGVYSIAQEADARFEHARRRIASFINAPEAEEIAFTKNVTEALNLVAQAWGRANLRPGDAIVLSEMEHHSNIVPWQMLQQQIGFDIRYLRVHQPEFTLDLSNLDELLDGAKLVSITAMSNVMGTLPPLDTIIPAAHAAGALVAIDAAQYVPHLRIDVQALGADFVAFTGHKMLGPTGIGVLWGRRELLEAMPPFLGGGGMIREVRLEGFTAEEIPHKFEAGTPPIAEAIGLAAACDELDRYGMDAIWEHEQRLTSYAIESLSERFGDEIIIYGPRSMEARGGVLSIGFRGLHPHDITQVLDQHGVCVRAGHHCAKPLMKCLNVAALVRASFYVYNDESDVDALADALTATSDFFSI
ncbi:MAG: aminotransferase class V-fold PLP-dependent enzyme [Acidimicrobiia bacterium]